MVNREEYQTPGEQPPKVKLGRWFKLFPSLPEPEIARDDYVIHSAKFLIPNLGEVSADIWWESDAGMHEHGGIFLDKEPRVEDEDGLDRISASLGKRLVQLTVGIDPLNDPGENFPYRVEARIDEDGEVVFSNIIPIWDGEKDSFTTTEDGWHLSNSTETSQQWQRLNIPYAEYLLTHLQIRIVPTRDGQ